MNQKRVQQMSSPGHDESAAALLHELAARLKDQQAEVREKWAHQVAQTGLFTTLSLQEILDDTVSVFDNYVAALATGDLESLRVPTKEFFEEIASRGVGVHAAVGSFMLLRAQLVHSLFDFYSNDPAKLRRMLDAFDWPASRLAIGVITALIQEHEQTIREQEKAIRELSTPVLQMREGLLILPVIGTIDAKRARQLTEQLLYRIRADRAKVVVMDVTGVAAVDSDVANHLVRTVEAAHLLGATVIVSGLSLEVAQTLVNIEVNLGRMTTVSDLQEGIKEAERRLGYKVVAVGDGHSRDKESP